MTRLTIICISFIIVILMFAGQSYAQIDPDTILGIWLLDEGTGDITADASGNGHDGTLMGSPNWVAGWSGNALEFDGSSTYVDFGNAGALNVGVFSVSFRCNIPSTQGWNHIVSRGSHQGDGNPGGVNWGVMMYDGQATILYEAYNDTVKPSLSVDTTTGEWHHVVATCDGVTMQLYHDGQLAGTEPASIFLDQSRAFLIGVKSEAGYVESFFSGSIDEVGYFSVVLTPEDIEMIMTYGLAEITKGPTAVNPRPVEDETEVQRDVVLSWEPGEFAAPTNGHKVYFSENFDDVSNGIGAITQSASSYTPAQHLDFGTTYYWRVDEVNNVNPDSPWIGDVWSFTTDPFAYAVENITATASSSLLADTGPSNTVNGSGLDADDLHSTEQTAMWISGSEPNGAWIEFELDKIYKLHEMSVWNSNGMMESFIGYGCKDVTIEYSVDGNDYTTLGATHEFAQAPGTPGYAHNTTIDFGGAAAKNVRLTANNNWGGGIVPQYSLSEVRFFYIPILAREPQPESGATDMDVDLVLSWKAGREAAEHNVYISTDEQGVIDSNVPVSIVTEAQHGPISVNLGETYYWKVNEVNMAETPTMSEGDIWNFSTHEYFVVDDFEDYNDWPPDEIWSTWVDGYGVPANGATSGYPAPDFLAGEHYVETTSVHGGAQSMPFFYDNTGAAAYSEAERTFAVPQDWTKAGVQTLVLYFQGNPGNTGQLYVKVNGSKVVYPGDAGDIAKPWWNQCSIDLASLGLNLQSVTTLAIGIEGSGAGGTLYFDDIRLYRLAPVIVVSSEEIWIEAEAANTITAPMKTYDDPLASGGQYIGTDDGIGDEMDAAPADGVATYNFTVQGGTYKISCRIIIPSGDSFWVRIPGATTLTPGEDPDQPGTGWVRWSDPPNSDNWYWYDVFSGDHDDETANWTLSAGAHTLEIARREDGALLDIIVISKIDY